MSSTTAQTFDRAQIRRNLDDFTAFWLTRVQGWRENKETATEKKYAQQFWTELFNCFGVNAARMDLFEQDARRSSTGGTGYIDLFWPGVVIGEAKSLGVDLDIAHEQARDYLTGGSVSDFELPRYILCSNFETLRLSRLGDPDTRFDITFPLSDISDHIDQLRFLAGYETVTKKEEEEASIQASKLMATLFTAMAGDEVDEAIGDDAPTDPDEEDERTQQTSMYLTRLLFLLFGDDAGLWETDIFYRFVLEHTTPENLGGQLNSLFEVLNTPENRRQRVPEHLAKFPYVNGSIFADSMRTEYFDPAMRDALLDACRFHWSHISPAVFGSMFQLVKSKEARRNDGEHYTSEKNILKTIEPLFLDELRAEATRLIAASSTPVKKLRDFRDSLADMVFVDPACGAGNFLVVAYRELRKIETDVIVAIRKREGNTGMALDVTWEQKLSIGQFYGFELNWWPAKIAETAMFLVDHQANRELADAIGAAPDRLPITITAHIIHGNALHLDWNTVLPQVPMTYVFGNPPFIGARLMGTAQKEELNKAWEGLKGTNQLDYVTGWHAKALTLLGQRRGMFAFVTTNSIVQGDQTPRLFGPIFAAGWRIRFAHRTFSWDSEAPGKAAVHCVIVGFDRHHEPRAQLWDYPNIKDEPVPVAVERGINAYLVDGPNVLVESRRTPLSSMLEPAVFGNMPNDGGYLAPKAGIPRPEHDPIAMKYVRRFVGAQELIRGIDRWCFWMADGNFIPGDVADSPELKIRIENVRTLRLSSKREATQKLAHTPYLFAEVRQPKVDYVAIPRHVSETRRYWTAAHLSPDVICGDSNCLAEDPDGLQFALISSSMFITWQRTVGGRIKSDLRFANTLTWNTFPAPEFDEATQQTIINAGQKVLEARAKFPTRSLADHYTPLAMDPDLLKAHDKLDRAVDKAFGATRKLTNEKQRQEILFANYYRMTQ
ncbi:DNA methyltransferase [Corynebacterium glutamicum]|uniref:DNA methyltransferase n=1 Tax=Corynebacterium glutamicum TaxID=1718 RepID=UPI00058A5D0E|nr:DNA methyltransferase [Corynebacterium glutamicum]AJE68858.1 GcrY protein [Corynebacterium glutamicum]OKX90469.1 GcrY protein [Corynebacterium glutamicum]